jgi:dCMP deaminase
MYCSGKDSVAEYLMKKGFTHYSLSDFLRAELDRQGKERTRDALVELGNKLRAEQGQGVLGKRAFEKIGESKEDFVVSSIRHPEEARALMKHGHFFFVEIRSPLKTRFERIKKRNRENDPKTIKELKEYEELESQKQGPGQQLSNVIKMTKYVIKNESSLAQLYKKTNSLVDDLRKKAEKLSVYVRPSWDEYFMGIVDATAKRATCDRGRTAVVVVKDKRILTTGYVGSPMGLPHCDEAGHQMKKMIHEDGSITQHCVRTNHAEVNAIALAARNGIAIDGSTLYCKLEPCYTCAKMLVNAGIVRVVCLKRYHAAKDTRELLKQAGVELVCLSEELEIYENQ